MLTLFLTAFDRHIIIVNTSGGLNASDIIITLEYHKVVRSGTANTANHLWNKVNTKPIARHVKSVNSIVTSLNI